MVLQLAVAADQMRAADETQRAAENPGRIRFELAQNSALIPAPTLCLNPDADLRAAL